MTTETNALLLAFKRAQNQKDYHIKKLAESEYGVDQVIYALNQAQEACMTLAAEVATLDLGDE